MLRSRTMPKKKAPEKKRGPGRPPSGLPRRLHIAVYVTPEELAAIDAVCGETGRSAWVLDAVREKLGRA